MIDKDKILGRVTHTYGQVEPGPACSNSAGRGAGAQRRRAQTLRLRLMDAFRNWRWYRQYSGGPMADLGSHQIDIFNWFLHTHPHAVLAAAGSTTTPNSRAAIGTTPFSRSTSIRRLPARSAASTRCSTPPATAGSTSSSWATKGTLVLSDDGKTGHIFREVTANAASGKTRPAKVETLGRDAIELKIGETLANAGKKRRRGPGTRRRGRPRLTRANLENFFNSIRGDAELTCPAEVAFGTCVSVLRANDAVASGGRMEFKPTEFSVCEPNRDSAADPGRLRSHRHVR